MRTRRDALGWCPVAALVLLVSMPRPARADQVVADDLIVQGSTCIGTDCVDNESFGFDTVRVKQGDIRLRFDDTSVSAGFPNHDWEILVNESTAGGLNRFSILEDTAGTTPFTILGNAPTNSLFIDATGKVGLGTATPASTLDVSGNANVTGTLTVGTFTLPSTLSANSLTLTGAASASSVAVTGDVDVAGALEVGGTINGRDLAADGARLDAAMGGMTDVKAGVIPIAAFSKQRPSAAVTFQTPYGQSDVYVVMFTVVTKRGRPPMPLLTEKSPTGFTVSLGTRRAGGVTEVQWFTHLVGG